jgi:hypothetical protein
LRRRKPPGTAILERRRPFGVYAVAALLLLDAVVLILNAQNVQLSRVFNVHLPGGARLHMPLLDWVAAIVIVILVGGLVALKRWAWVGTMVVVGIGLAVGIWLYFEQQPRFGNMIVNVVVVFYMNQRGVQAAFAARKKRVH